MKNNFIHNFFEGITSKYLKEKLNIDLNTFQNVSLNKFQKVTSTNIITVQGRAIMKKGEDEFLMFAYKPKYDIGRWRKKPSYHTRECKTILKYSNANFIYANKMPVDIYSTSTGEILKDQNLKICGNCVREGRLSLFRSSRRNTKDWYDEVLDFVETLSNPIRRRDGYITFWSQVSEAYRRSKNWTCEKCGLRLRDNRKYLHTHHKDGNKLNNSRNNFESLCILCHAFEHFDKEKRGEGFLELEQFISEHKLELVNCNKQNLNKWEQLKKERMKILKK